jgi:hypothetical protein
MCIRRLRAYEDVLRPFQRIVDLILIVLIHRGPALPDHPAAQPREGVAWLAGASRPSLPPPRLVARLSNANFKQYC